MASAQFSVTSGSVATSTTAKTVLAITSTATNSPEVIGFDFSTDATVTTGVFLVELVEYTTGTGTAGSTPTIQKMGSSQVAGVTTAGAAYSAEPTGPLVMATWWILAQGTFAYLLPLGREFQVPVSKMFGIRVTAPSGTPNVRANLYFEE